MAITNQRTITNQIIDIQVVTVVEVISPKQSGRSLHGYLRPAATGEQILNNCKNMLCTIQKWWCKISNVQQFNEHPISVSCIKAA